MYNSPGKKVYCVLNSSKMKGVYVHNRSSFIHYGKGVSMDLSTANIFDTQLYAINV